MKRIDHSTTNSNKDKNAETNPFWSWFWLTFLVVSLVGLEPIAEFLKNRFDFEWNLEEQIKRSEEFEREKLQHQK
jgi:hypothetical protein